MLVLSRQQGERIHIGENITITIVKLGGRNVRIGIVAPGLKIVREELVEAIEIEREMQQIISTPAA